MTPENRSEQERLILLAIEERKRDPALSVRDLARRFQVPRSTLQARLNGRPSKLQANQNNHLMTSIEEESLKKWIIYLNSIGRPPQHPAIRKKANAILAGRGTTPPLTIGNNWLPRYLKRNPDLTTKIAGPRDYSRAYSETPKKFNDWFDRVENTIIKFGIDQHDVYNVDVTGFAMGVLSATRIITGTESREDPGSLEPGNCEWVTATECISAAGFALPPFIIMKGKRLQRHWYKHLPPQWEIGVSENGWKNNEMALSWLKKIFIPSTENTKGIYRLLIVDGHGSHLTERFKELCEENRIKIQCMPAHASHRLQPLDLVCFSVLKRAYRNVINEKLALGVTGIDKFEFLEAYPKARIQSFRENNIESAYRTAGLFPPNRKHVLSKLPKNNSISTTERELGTKEVTPEDPQDGS